MSSSIGLIISMLFVAITFMFGGDLLTLQAAFTALENAASDIAYYFAIKSVFNEEEINKLETLYSVEILYNEEDFTNEVGAYVEFGVQKTVDHLFIMGTEYTLTVQRSAVLGSYGMFFY